MSEIAIIGTGDAGLHFLDAALIHGLASRYVVIDPDDGESSRSTLELEAAIATRRAALLQLGQIEIRSARHVSRAASADLVVIALGDPALRNAGGRSGVTQMTRDRVALLRNTAPVIERIIAQIFESPKCDAAVLLLDDPVDALTTIACQTAGRMVEDPSDYAERVARVLGIGTVSATLRFQRLLARKMGVDPDDVDALVVGEKGRMEIPLWSSATVAQTPVHLYHPRGKRPITVRERVTIFEQVRDAHQAVDAAGGTSYFADALAAVEVARSVLYNEECVHTVSVWQDDGPEDHERKMESVNRRRACAFAWPAIVGRKGIVRVLNEIPFNENEHAAIAECARSVRTLVEAAGNLR